MENVINVLGTEYRIETNKISENKTLRDNQWCGYCDEDAKLIVVADMSEKEFVDIATEEGKRQYANKILRHEIVHSFLNESGLASDSHNFAGPWARNEEMIDWFAIQAPKIFSVYQQLGIL